MIHKTLEQRYFPFSLKANKFYFNILNKILFNNKKMHGNTQNNARINLTREMHLAIFLLHCAFT